MPFSRALLTLFLFAFILLLVENAQAENHHKEYQKPDKHLLREKKAKEHHTYFHNDKQLSKQVKKSYKFDGPHHEEKMQKDVAEPHERRSDAWHKKDLHLQDLSYEPQREHHANRNQHRTKPHHSWNHHSGKHSTDHHKGEQVKDSSSESGYLHKPHKATPSTFEEKHHMLSKSLQHSPKEHNRPHHKEDSHQIHFLTNKKAKSGGKEHFLSKIKKQKDKKPNYEKKQKAKQHRKKLGRGELHKLW